MMFEPAVEFPASSPEERTIRESGIRHFARALRERWLIVAITVVAAIAAAGFYVSSATPTYQAQANLLISPETDTNLSALPLFRSSSDPTRDTETASLLVYTPETAQQAARLLHTSESAQAVLARVQVTPVAGSDVIAVTASASTPAEAARVANAFAQAAIAVLGLRLQAQLKTAIPRLEAQVSQSPQSASPSAADSLASQLAALRALQGAPDPTIQLESPATAPQAPVSPRKALSLLAGAILGLLLGIAIALAADAFDPRLRRESQLHEVLDLPILARVPWLPDGGERQSRDPHELKSLLTAHEFLAEALGVFDGGLAGHKRTIVFTAADRNAGCTTTAVHHAWLVAAAGGRVVLIDGDPRDPAVGSATGARPSPQLKHVLVGSRPIKEALVSVEAGGVELRVLAVDERLDDGFGTRMPTGREMIAELLLDADALVVDAPPLTQSARALMLARSVDHVVVVARIGVTRLAELRELGELLTSHGVSSAGMVVVGGLTGTDAGRERGQALARAWRSTRSGSGKNGRRSPSSADVNPQHALPSGEAAKRGRRGAAPGP
jgi:capsular polysaccharide biosynthesis protein/MinD-like ATPase involved in chromosome partitioning or flagellar assembly